MFNQDEDRHKAQGIALAPLVKQLRASCEATARLQGGYPYHVEQVALFRELAQRENLLLKEPPQELSITPDDEGNEHQVWFREDRASFLKATWPGHFGMLVIHRNDEEPSASPIDYLIRWELHNLLFGDSVTFLGAVDTPHGMRLLVEQPAIQGEPASEKQIDNFFTESDWEPFHIKGNQAYFDRERRLVVSDTHRGNLILMPDGTLAPIDFRVQKLDDTLLDIVQTLLS